MLLGEKDNEDESITLQLYSHQLYDVIWKRLKCSKIGGAIHADEPGFGKLCVSQPLR